jgi:hypothetical protein
MDFFHNTDKLKPKKDNIESKILELIGKSKNGQTQNIIPLSNDAIHSEIYKILYDFFGSNKLQEFEDIGIRHTKPQPIDIREIYSFQPKLLTNQLIHFIRVLQKGKDVVGVYWEGMLDESYIVKYKNKKYCINGNHRISAMKFFGKTTAKVQFLDLDDIVKNGFRG